MYNRRQDCFLESIGSHQAGEGYERFPLKRNAEWLGKTAAILGEIHEGYTFHDLSSDLRPFGFAVTERSRNEIHGMMDFVAVKGSAPPC
jgi:hypothetical protein